MREERDIEGSDWKLPVSYQAEKKPNGLILAFNVWWLSLTSSVVCWILFVVFYVTDDALTDRLFFGLYLATLTGVIYSVIYTFAVLPFFLICCARPKFWFTNTWLIFVYSLTIGFLGLELVSQLIAGESVIVPFDWMSLYGAAYGAITGIVAKLKISRSFLTELNEDHREAQ